MFRLTAAASLGVIVVASGQQAPPQPTFRAGVNYVQVDARVIDENGDPIVDLQKGDFEVFEDGRRQTISAFMLVQIPYQPHVDQAPLDSDVVSNGTEPDRRLWAIVLDDLQTRKDRIPALRATAQELVNRLGPYDLAAIVPTSAERDSQQEFTNNRAALSEAISRSGSRSSESGLAAIFNNARSISTIGDVARHMSTVEARSKNVLYIGSRAMSQSTAPCVAKGSLMAADGVVPPSAQSAAADDESCKAVTSLNRQNVHVFNVLPSDGTPQVERRPRLELPPPLSKLPAKGEPPQTAAGPFLARESGGMTIGETAAMHAIDAILRTTGTFYLIAYYADPPKYDGKYHKIDVRVGRAGADVRARRSYIAPKSNAAPKPADRARLLNASLEDVVSQAGLSLHALVVPMRGAKHDSETLVVALGIDHDLGGHRAKVDLDAAIVVNDMKPKIRAQSWPAMHFHADDLTKPYPPTGPQEVVERLDVPPGHYQVRLGVRCMEDDAVGSVYADMDVPDFAKERLSMSGIILDAPGRPDAVQGARLRGLIPIVPTTARAFDRGPLHIFARVYEGERTVAADVKVVVTIADAGGAEVFRRQGQLPASAFRSDRSADVDLSVPLDELPAGALRLTIAAESSDGSQAVRALPFTTLR